MTIADWISLIALAFTVASAVIARNSLAEAKRTRRSLRLPELIVKKIFGQLVIINIGAGAAFNVWAEIKTYQWDKLESSGSGPLQYSYILPNDEMKIESPIPIGDAERREITLKFESIYKEIYKVVFTEDVDLKGTQKRSVLLKSSKLD